MDDGHGEPASLAHSLASAFPDTPLYLAHFSLQYYSDESRGASSGALPWISKSLRLGDAPLPVLARNDFEAPAATWMSSKCHSVYLEHLVGLGSGQVTVSALLGRLGTYVPPSISADGFPELCAAIFEAYVQTCDALDLCIRLRELSVDGAGAGGDDEAGESVRRALEDLELQVRFFAAIRLPSAGLFYDSKLDSTHRCPYPRLALIAGLRSLGRSPMLYGKSTRATCLRGLLGGMPPWTNCIRGLGCI